MTRNSWYIRAIRPFRAFRVPALLIITQEDIDFANALDISWGIVVFYWHLGYTLFVEESDG